VPIDTSTAAGKAFLDMLRVFADFETNLSNERQLEGIPKAKARGVCVSRTKLNRARVRELWQEGMRAAAIAKAIGCSRATVYNILVEPGQPLVAAE
jgi:DNA invertase Pin-like site-specific DNA recombinase